MQYRKDKYGNDLSILGFGCMRFQQKLGRIDFEKAEKQIMLAIDGGVNYFDTAYIYPGSEALLGEVLEKNHARDKVYIATKLPHYLIKSQKDLDRLFSEELRRLRTDHVDYYLMHADGCGYLEPAESVGCGYLAGGEEGQRCHPPGGLFLSREFRNVLPSGRCLRLGLLPDSV